MLDGMSDAGPIELRDHPSGAGAVCREVLATLPSWFGIAEAVDDYVAMAEAHPTVVAWLDGRPVGLLTVVRHFPEAAEVHVMGVVPEHHRHGIGRRMLAHVEAQLAADGARLLQVKTLAASHPDEGYAKTRAFYRACGFMPLEEMADLWDPRNPALLLVKPLPAHDLH